MENIIDKGLLVRVITSIVVWLNTILAAQGIQIIPFGEENIYLIVSLIVTIIASAWTGWKNNNFTSAAKEAQTMLEELKVQAKLNEVINFEDITIEEIEEEAEK